MNILFNNNAWEDYLYWQQIDKKLLKKINELIKDIKRNPDDKNGLGKPELLKNDLKGYMSRRINDEHRLIYKIENDNIIIVSCRFHYKK